MIILMIKTIIIDATETQLTPKKDKTIYSGKRKTHDQKTQVLSNKKPKNYCNKFFALKKHDYAFYLKNQKSHLKKYQINSR
ncbi:hypothetical protein [Spiroplasma poulsonii]|uniref:hypothetical protein n=1 Tax=Spiroplasma poulsonii TaxID=2138 RepID=UPI001F4CA9F7|nr:hypothetical protein [Spiroplasma poulsonii]UNF61580.1 hypothetical protein MNU24_06625 [Spiroplasma poulsonii]